jgi:predicted ABC-type ATPase
MIQPNNQPKLVIFAGPNGSGKSTITATFKESAGFPNNYINPDDIARNLVDENRTVASYDLAEVSVIAAKPTQADKEYWQ